MKKIGQYSKLIIIFIILFSQEWNVFSQGGSNYHTLIFKDEESYKKLKVILLENKSLNAMCYRATIPKSLKKYEHLSSESFEYIFNAGFGLNSSYSGGMIKCEKDTTKQNYTLFGLHTSIRYSPKCDRISPIFVLGKQTAWKRYGDDIDNIHRSEKYFLTGNIDYITYTYQFFSGKNAKYNFVTYDFCPKIGIVKATFKDVVRIRRQEIVKLRKERHKTFILYSIDGLSVEEFCKQGKCITICCDLKEVE